MMVICLTEVDYGKNTNWLVFIGTFGNQFGGDREHKILFCGTELMNAPIPDEYVKKLQSKLCSAFGMPPYSDETIMSIKSQLPYVLKI